MSVQLDMEQFFGGASKINAISEPHLACVLLLDTSEYMGNENGAIDSLNDGIKRFKAELMLDPIVRARMDVALVAFNSTVEIVSDFKPIDQMPTPELVAGGGCDMARGIQTAIDLVKERTAVYSTLGTPCYKPLIFMITGGKSTSDDHEMREAAERIQQEEEKGSHGRLSFWALGMENYDPEELFRITKRVMELKNVDFAEILEWLGMELTGYFCRGGQFYVEQQLKRKWGLENAKRVEKDRAIDEGWY